MPLLLCCLLISADAPAPADIHIDFQNSAEGSMPDELMVINGKFEVKKEGDNKFLQLPGEPLDSFAFMLGGDEHSTITASIRASKTGKRFPEFGVGLRGAAGYRLWLMPAVNEIQLLKGDDVKISKPYTWKSGQWLNLKLQVKKQNQKMLIEAKVWDQDTPVSPDSPQWSITFEDSEKPPKGRPSVWGVPYSGTPIDFDDISITIPK